MVGKICFVEGIDVDTIELNVMLSDAVRRYWFTYDEVDELRSTIEELGITDLEYSGVREKIVRVAMTARAVDELVNELAEMV